MAIHFKCADGKWFSSLDDARRHEFRIQIGAVIDSFYHENIDLDAIVDGIVENNALVIEAVNEYVKYKVVS